MIRRSAFLSWAKSGSADLADLKLALALDQPQARSDPRPPAASRQSTADRGARRLKCPTHATLWLKTSMSIDDYRPGLDVPFPLLPNGVASHATPEELAAAAGRRHLLLSFKGTCQASSLRPKLERLHNGKDVIIVCSNKGAPSPAPPRSFDLRRAPPTSSPSALSSLSPGRSSRESSLVS